MNSLEIKGMYDSIRDSYSSRDYRTAHKIIAQLTELEFRNFLINDVDDMHIKDMLRISNGDYLDIGIES